MPKDFFINKLINEFKGVDYVGRVDLLRFYRQFEPNLKESTFGWRLYDLRQKGILQKVGKVLYTLNVKTKYHPIIDNSLKELYNKASKQYPHSRICVWNTKWINEWMVHQPGIFLPVIEAEETVAESIFHFLRDNKFNIYINPDASTVKNYIYRYDPHPTIILKTLYTKAPLIKQQRIVIPTLEKIMVDLFCDKVLFVPFQGAELSKIFNTIHQKYDLNFSKLFAYSKRRGREEDIAEFIEYQTKIKIPEQILE